MILFIEDFMAITKKAVGTTLFGAENRLYAKFMGGTLPKPNKDGPKLITSACPLFKSFQLLFSTYIFEGAPNSIQLRTATRKCMKDEFDLEGKKMPIEFYDDAILEVLDILYESVFKKEKEPKDEPRVSLTRASSNAQVQKLERSPSTKENNLSRKNTETSVTPRVSVAKNRVAQEARYGEALESSKEGFIKMLKNPIAYDDFKDMVRAEMCFENIQFFEAFSIQEERALNILKQENKLTVDGVTLLPAIERFLQKTDYKSTYIKIFCKMEVPSIVSWDYISLYSTFIVVGAPNEINLSDKARRMIMDTLSLGGHVLPLTYVIIF